MDFNELLKEAEELLVEGNEVQDSTHINRNLEQIVQEAHELPTLTRPTSSNDAQADIWLRSKGIDLPKLTQTLESLNIDSLDPVERIDADKFIKDEKENAIISVIDEVNKYIKLDNVEGVWSKEKRLLLNTLGGPSQNYVDLQRKGEKILIHKISNCCNEYYIERYFAKEVEVYNKEEHDNKYVSDLLEKFAIIVEGIKENNNNNKFWSILVNMASKWNSTSNIDPMKRRQEKQEEFIGLGKTYLEKKYRMYMSSAMEANLGIAERGGEANMVNFIKGFVRVYLRANKMTDLVEVYNGQPLWSHIYFAMRCGAMEIILEFNKKFGSPYVEFIKAFEGKIEHPEEDISPELEKRLALQYMNTIKNSTDPFQKALFCIIIGHNVEESLPLVDPTEDDKLWTLLSIVRKHRKSRKSSHIEELTYFGLQSLILEEYGGNEKYINDSKKELDYFQLLILTGQFEAGIDFMARREGKYSHAVHMAIALNELYLLCTPRDVETPLLSTDDGDPQPMKRLNLTRMILRYIKCLGCKYNIIESLNYSRLLRKYKYNNGQNVFVTCVCDLAINSFGFVENFFGELSPTGKHHNMHDFFERLDNSTVASMITMVAEELERCGSMENAIFFFDLSGSHEKALKLLNSLLTECIHKAPEPNTLRERFTEYIEVYTERLKAHLMVVQPETVYIFQMLSDLLIFFNLYYEKKDSKALEWLSSFCFIPMNAYQLKCSLIMFNHLPGELTKLVPDILLATMTILHRKCLKLKKIFKEPNNAELLRLLDKAKILLNMAASISDRIPVNVIKRLMDLEMSMNSHKLYHICSA